MYMNRLLKILPVLFICFVLVSCTKMVKKESAEATAPPSGAAVSAKAVAADDPEALLEEDIRTMIDEGEGMPSSAQLPSSAKELEGKAVTGGKLYMVHFDFDRYVIKDEYKGRLRANAKWLKKNSGVSIVIEGHADERGENEYNLALGDKRATSVRRYLKALGVKISNLSTISYGEEKPLNEEHSDVAWAENRRAEFRISN
jgi:peptidoglycan-associated lipoprotein